jgi:hypothetical protein
MNFRIFSTLAAGVGAAIVVALAALPAEAACAGSCGTAGADGVVPLSPTGNAAYQWISTNNVVNGVGQIAGVPGGTNGSEYASAVFSASQGQSLSFYADYVTSDGLQYQDYAWAELRNASTNAVVAYLFTGLTNPPGDIGSGNNPITLPAAVVSVGDAASMTAGGPTWSPLGTDSGSCYGTGCGYSGWVQSNYAIQGAGTYQVVFGVTNLLDTAYQTGLAFDGLNLAGTPIGGGPVPGVPEPSTWAMLLIGLLGFGAAARNRARKNRDALATA